MPKLYNLKKDENIPKDAVFIGRGSKWGNRYIIGREGNRDNVCDLFVKYQLPFMDVSELRGKDLVCFCVPLRCHGEDIMRKANG